MALSQFDEERESVDWVISNVLFFRGILKFEFMLKGQLHSETKFGAFLREFSLERRDLKNFVEIGTWNGQGSTLQIASSLAERSDGSSLFSFEADGDMLRTAMENYHHPRDSLHFVHGRISDRIMTLEEVRWHPLYKGADMEGWLEGETKAFESAPLNRDVIPTPLDFVLLDGGEFTTIGDWKYLKTLGPKVVALTCTGALKSHDIFEELDKTASWKIVGRGDEFQGWAVFENMRHGEVKEDDDELKEEASSEKTETENADPPVDVAEEGPPTTSHVVAEVAEDVFEPMVERPFVEGDKVAEIPPVVADREVISLTEIESVSEKIEEAPPEIAPAARRRTTKKDASEKPKKAPQKRASSAKKTHPSKKLVITDDADTPEVSPVIELSENECIDRDYREGAPSPESSGAVQE